MIYVDIDIDIDIDIHTDTHTHTNTHCISKILHAHQTTCTRSSCATTWLNLCIASAYLSAATSACVSVYVCARVRTHGLSLALSLSRARARSLALDRFHSFALSSPLLSLSMRPRSHWLAVSSLDPCGGGGYGLCVSGPEGQLCAREGGGGAGART